MNEYYCLNICNSNFLYSSFVRFAKLLRLLRLIRIAKVLKWMMGYRKKKEENTPDEHDEIGVKMSNVGRHMTESITKKGKRRNIFFNNLTK